MASRPSRTTRSSTATTTSAPATRSTRSSTSTAPSTSSSSALPPPVRRTTRASRAATPTQAPEIKPVNPPVRASSAAGIRSTFTRASTATSNTTATKPSWNARPSSALSNGNTSTPPTKRGSTLAVPSSIAKPKTPGGGLLGRMTSSRESLRPTAGARTPAPPPMSVRRMTGAGQTGVEGYDGSREPIKAYLRVCPAPPGVPLQSYVQVLSESEVLMVPPLDHRLNPSSSSSSIYSNALLRNTSQQRLSTLHLNLDPSSHPAGVPEGVCASPTPHASHHQQQAQQPDPSTYGALYKFTGVFPRTPASPTSPTSPTSSSLPNMMQIGDTQASFFASTALPLVRDFLQKAENCLLFAYGPTGSGKTFTVQGGHGEDAGLLPRIVEVVWGSLKGKEKPMSPAPAAMNGKRGAQQPMHSTPVKPSLKGLGAKESLPMGERQEVIPVDDGFEYAVYVSYSEIYNEKIYDLLESPLPVPAPSTSSTTSTGGGGMLKGLFKNFTTVKRSALSLKADHKAQQASGAQPKVVGGLREVRVTSAEEAHRVLLQGQSNRRVFSTLANRASSRSHSIFSIKVVRTPRGSSSSSASPEHSVTSKFSVVDLAGSERVQNTQTTGERLKEAGNINKSLMVLGQCMEVLRKNQERGEGRKPAIVPFRHSKLTEMFQSFFIGEGKAVMIVNINPYSTSYDENSHVMKFSAVARGVMTVQRNGNALVLPSKEKEQEKGKEREEKIEEEGEEENEQQEGRGETELVLAGGGPKKRESVKRVVRLSLVEGGEEEDVMYEEEASEDDEDEGEDQFVNALLDELSALRTALFESQMSTVLAEANARKRVVQEYEGKMLDMERHYQERMREEAIEAENKLNAKLDILTRLQAAKTPARNAMINRLGSVTPSTVYDDSDESGEEDEEEGEGESGEVEKTLLPGSDRDEAMDADVSITESAASPLAARIKVHLTASHSPSPLAAAPPVPLISSSAPKSPSPLAHNNCDAQAEQAPSPTRLEEQRDATDGDSSRLTEVNEAEVDAMPEGSSIAQPQNEGDTSVVSQQMGNLKIGNDAYDEDAEGDGDLSRLTEQSEEGSEVEHSEGEEDEEEEEEDESVINLSRATEELGGSDEEVSRKSFIDDEVEEGDEHEEEELTELEELEGEEGSSFEEAEGEEQDEDGGDDYVEGEEANADEYEPSPSHSSEKKPNVDSTPALTSSRQPVDPEDESFDTFSPVKTPAAPALSPTSPSKQGSGNGEKENVAPSPGTETEDGEYPDADEDVDEFGMGLERSMVIQSGSKNKKSKRKLGKKVKDADDLDLFAEGILSPIRPKTGSIRSFEHY
ncbi:hypothetical protein JCM11641_001608 [Rhodosporidiobolus odoratus]